MLHGLAALMPGGIRNQSFMLLAGAASVAMIVLIGPAIEEALRIFFADFAAERGATPNQVGLIGAQFGAIEALTKTPMVFTTLDPVVGQLGLVAGALFIALYLALPIAMHTLQGLRLAGPLRGIPAKHRLRHLWTGHALYNGASMVSAGLLPQAMQAATARPLMIVLSLVPAAGVLTAMAWNYRRAIHRHGSSSNGPLAL